MKLRRLLTFHALVTFAAGVVLIAAPGLIPGAVGVRVPSDAYLVCYLLGAAELAVAFLSFAGRNLRQSDGVRLVTWTMIVFHGCTAAVEVYAFARGVHAGIWANVALRAAQGPSPPQPRVPPASDDSRPVRGLRSPAGTRPRLRPRQLVEERIRA